MTVCETAKQAEQRLSKAIRMVRMKAAGTRGFILEGSCDSCKGLCVDGRSIDFAPANGRGQQTCMGKFDDLVVLVNISWPTRCNWHDRADRGAVQHSDNRWDDAFTSLEFEVL